MNSTPKSESFEPKKKSAKKSDPARFFYLMAALVLLALALAGFQEFYVHGREFGGGEIPPRIFSLVVVHATLMSFWILLFIVQPFLIVSGNRRFHMKLGWFGAVLAVAIFVTGVAVSIESARVHPGGALDGMPRRQFLAVPFCFMAEFLIFVSLGVLARRRPEIHRAMMLLATLVTVQAATDRIPFMMRMYYDEGPLKYFLGPATPVLIIGAFFLVVRWLLTRRFDRWYALGYAGLCVAAPLMMDLSRSRAWDRIGAFFLR
jgi:hypothetical protein